MGGRDSQLSHLFFFFLMPRLNFSMFSHLGMFPLWHVPTTTDMYFMYFYMHVQVRQFAYIISCNIALKKKKDLSQDKYHQQCTDNKIANQIEPNDPKTQ